MFRGVKCINCVAKPSLLYTLGGVLIGRPGNSLMRVRERTEAEEDLRLVQSPNGIAMASTGTTVLCLSFLNTSSPIPSLPAIFLSMCVWHVYTSVL